MIIPPQAKPEFITNPLPKNKAIITFAAHFLYAAIIILPDFPRFILYKNFYNF